MTEEEYLTKLKEINESIDTFSNKFFKRRALEKEYADSQRYEE
jgi:hypothetical protein